MVRIRRTHAISLLAVGAFVGPALGCSAPTGCADNDGDGFGVECQRGPDCDDHNAARTDNCDAVPPPDCSAAPTSTGCPCLVGDATPCFPGTDDQRGVGLCREGASRCIGGTWGLCEGSVSPVPEVCNHVDDDCDGVIDNGVGSPCGGCTPGCEGGVWGVGGEPFVATSSTALTERGGLTLRRLVRTSNTVWVANSAEDTVSKIDAIEAREVARYASGGDEPSRIAVDYLGDAWVANRAFGAQATVTKIAGSRDRCVDRHAPAGIQTSTGPLGVLTSGTDECVLFTVPVPPGEPGKVARALAIDGTPGVNGSSGGNVWVGLYAGREVIELDGQTGAVLRRVALPDVQGVPDGEFRPYSASFDAWGTLWLMSPENGLLARVDRAAATPIASALAVPLSCYVLYSLTVDFEGRVLVTGFSCDDAARYDPFAPSSAQWSAISTVPSPRGVVTAGPYAWAVHTGGSLSRIRLEPFAVVRNYALASGSIAPLVSIGAATDGSGNVWAVSTEGGPRESGIATRFNPNLDQVTAQVPVGKAPHTQGDLTGTELRGGFISPGENSHVFTGCARGSTRWKRLHVERVTSALGVLRIELRRAADAEGLLMEPFIPLAVLPVESPPFDLALEEGGVVEVRLIFETNSRDGAPLVKSVGVEWECDTIVI